MPVTDKLAASPEEKTMFSIEEQSPESKETDTMGNMNLSLLIYFQNSSSPKNENSIITYTRYDVVSNLRIFFKNSPFVSHRNSYRFGIT